MAEAVLGTHDDWQIGKTKIFLKVSRTLRAKVGGEGSWYLGPCGCTGSEQRGGLGSNSTLKLVCSRVLPALS